jgi:hypothetical protein
VPKSYKEVNWSKNQAVEREPPFREDLSMEIEEKPLLEPLPGNY